MKKKERKFNDFLIGYVIPVLSWLIIPVWIVLIAYNKRWEKKKMKYEKLRT